MSTITNPPPISGPAPATAVRSRWSVRRTSTIDTTWPDGPDTAMHMVGHARDLLTPDDVANPVVLAEDRFTARLTPERTILELSTEPGRAAAADLVGARAGRHLRTAIANSLSFELAQGTPLYLLLDDIAGASLVAVTGAMRWEPQKERTNAEEEEANLRMKRKENVCIGFSSDSPVLQEGATDRSFHSRSVMALDNTADCHAWHELAAQHGPAARRARRIDVRFEEDLILVDSHFQDSYPLRYGGREAVHEYLLNATIDRSTMTIRSIVADPRILPFNYCPSAILSINRVVGTQAGALRQQVLETFPGSQGCTHLNDMMRSLAEVPQLATALAGAMAKGRPRGLADADR